MNIPKSAYLNQANNALAAQQYAGEECARDVSELETVLNVISDLISAASVNSDNVSGVAGKLLGAEPTSIGSEKTAVPSRSGLLGEIRDRLDNLGYHLRVTDGHIRRLRSAV